MEEKKDESLSVLIGKAVLAAIVILVTLCLATIAYYHHDSLLDFWSTFITYFILLLQVAFSGAVLFFGYKLLDAGVKDHHSRRKLRGQADRIHVQNRVLETKLLVAQALPDVMRDAIARGQNIEFEGLKIASPWSNIHTIHQDKAVDADPTKQVAAPTPRRLTIDEIVRHTERNSYRMFIGSSLTRNLVAVPISILKRHIKIIGATQKGKSSFVGAFIEIVTRTHDPEFVQFVFLDYQYQTTRLFADIPHLLEIIVDDKQVALHAKSVDEVCEYLEYVHQIMVARSKMGRAALKKLPLLIIFIEEFLRLKKQLKSLCVTAQDTDAAVQRFERFSFNIEQLAGLGLRERMQLLLVAQMDYADDDKGLNEAMINITSGISFCVRPTAAQSAGFYQKELIAQNARENKVGQGVCEMPDCNDLILAPEFDIEQRLIDREETEEEEAGEISEGLHLVRTLEPVESKISQEEAEIQKVVGAWNEGNRSIRKVMQATGLGQNRSSVLITKAKGKGLIEGE